MRNHKPKQWTEAEVQTLDSTAAEIAVQLERYIASVKRVARKMGLLPRGDGALR